MHTPSTFWLTGLSGAGKSTLATELHEVLAHRGRPCFVLDGDEVRRGLCRDLTFSHEDRTENIRRIAEVARLFNNAGLHVIAALISPYRKDREIARQIIGPAQFIEVFIDTSLDVCARRDTKGLYALARAGTLPDFTGVSAPYEAPHSPALTICTEGRSIEDCRRVLEEFVRSDAQHG